jgi:hypothetical protein
VLSVLAATSRPLTGREVARLAPEGSQPGVWKALSRLADDGLVDRQEAGSALLYSLNRDHLAAPAVEILTGLRGMLVTRLRDAIGGWELPPLHASLFGSAARGQGDAESDIDLFVVRESAVEANDPRWRAQLDGLARSIRRWTGNRAGISEISETDLERLRTERPAIVAELESDAVALFGAETATLLDRRRP